MKIKTADLTGPALNWAVRKTLHPGSSSEYVEARDNYSTCWNKGGPIIEQERIGLTYSDSIPCWYATSQQGRRFLRLGDTPLIAAMRCVVASRLGDEVDIPEELA